MITWIELGSAVVLTLTVTTAVAALMWRPLYAVLHLVCGEAVAARFWTTFASVMLVFGPLFLVCFAAGRAGNLAEFIRQAVYLISLGLIGAFVIMGLAVLRSAKAHEAPGKPGAAPAPPAGPAAASPAAATRPE